jgi:hypothetical protein
LTGGGFVEAAGRQVDGRSVGTDGLSWERRN